MATVSTLKLSPKGHLSSTMFNRAAILRHTHTAVPRSDCINCSTVLPLSSRPAITPDTNKKPADMADHQCLFCTSCLRKAGQEMGFSHTSGNSTVVRSSVDILGPKLAVKAGGEVGSSESRKLILTESLTALDRKPLFCGFCRKTSSGLPVRYCVQCQKYLCKGCYGKHQGEQGKKATGGKWMYRYHATLDLSKIRNPDVM